MSDNEIGFEEVGGTIRPTSVQTRRLVPMQIGDATVYIEQATEPLEIESDGDIYAASFDPEEAFEKAAAVLQQCAKTVGNRIERMAEATKPKQVIVEFTVSLEAKSKTQIIPILFTGEAKATTGLKVTAVWGKTEDPPRTPYSGGEGREVEDGDQNA